MSLIAAVFHFDQQPGDPHRMTAVLDAFANPGPDRVGAWAEGPVVLGQRTLFSTPQSVDERLPTATCSWEVPAGLYDPIEQQAIVLDESNAAATAFVDFLLSPPAQAVVIESGYGVLQ